MTEIMSTPESGDALRCLSIRKKSKQGIELSQDELEFCNSIRTQFPQWYSETNEEVFYATLPFGSTATYPQ